MIKLMGRTAVLIFFLLVVAACGTDNPPSESDWCFRFWFKESDYNVAISEGFWVPGVGLQPDETGHLSVSYDNLLLVNPTRVIITIARGEGTTGDIDVAAVGNIFGIVINEPDATIPAELDEFNLQLTPANVDDAASSFNVSAVAEDTMTISKLTVAGVGASPFPTDNCNGTPTPIPSTPVPTNTGTLVTPTPSNTLTPSHTPTPSDTPTPTNTPPADVCTVPFDFTTGNQRGWEIEENPPDEDGFVYTGALAEWTGTSFDSGQLDFTNPVSGDGQEQHTTIRRDIPGWNVLEVRIYFDEATESTTNTNTGAPSWTVALESENSGPQQWGTYGGPPTVTSPLTYTTPLGLPSPWIVIDSYLGGAADPDVMDGNFSIIRIEVDILTSDCDVFTPTPSLTPSPTNTLNLTWTATFTPPVGGSTGTPPTGTRTPTRTATNIVILTSPPIATFPPPVGTSTHVATTTPGGTPGGTPTPFTPVALTGTPPDGEPWATSVGPGIPFPGPGGGDGESGCAGSGLLTIVCNVVNTSTNAMNQAFGYISQLSGTALGIVTAYQSAAPTPVPGLPSCATNRFGSELCAIYYILTYTLFSGPIGSLIIPVAVIDVDIFIIFTFIKLARAILARLAGMLAQ